YDAAVRDFVFRVLPTPSGEFRLQIAEHGSREGRPLHCDLGTALEADPFLADLLALQRRVAFYGYFNSLSQLLLKCTCPGVPDFYQGMELWDLSLVDPDNRRPVDYARRRELFAALKTSAVALGEDLTS